jgi:hypothetical protein
MKEFIGVVTVILAFLGLIPYIVDIFKNKTKPHIFTWAVWAIITILAFIGQWQSGAGAGSWTTGVTSLMTIFIAIISFKYGIKDITKSDTIIFIAALLAVIPWYLTKNPTLSIIILTIIDVLAFIPTIRKTIKYPESETLSSYILHTIRHGLSIAAISTYSISTYLFPGALAIMNLIIALIIIKSRFYKQLG